MAFFPVFEYRPDISDLNTAYTDDIRNVIPADGSYIPMPSFKAFTQPFSELPLGAVAVRSLDGATTVFAGTAGKLYCLENTDFSWRDVSQKNVAYGANATARWSFAIFGTYVIAVNKNDPPQVFELGSSTHFRDLGGNPPRAGLVKIWGDFVCLMQLPDHPNRVHWSGLNDAEWWTVGQKNCDYQDFPDGGAVQGSNEATNPVIFLQSAIYAGMFVPGSEIIFSFQKIHDRRGVKSPWSIACRGAYVFYADEGGFFQIAADGSISPIGFEKVDRTVFSRLNTAAISEIFGAIDPFFSRVYWAVDYAGQGAFDEMLVYDWGLQRWSVISIRATAIMPIYNAGYTLEVLDKVSQNLDDLPFSLDSKAWQSGAPALGGFSMDYCLGSFSGPPMEAIVTTPEIAGEDGGIQRLTSICPLVDTDQVFVSVSARFRRTAYENVRWGIERQPSYHTGRCHMRSRARFHKFRLRVPEGVAWHHIKGFEVALGGAGRR